MAFAASVSSGEELPNRCPSLVNPISENIIYPIYSSSGDLISTVSIDVDSHKRKNEFDKQKEYTSTLEKKIKAIANSKNKEKNIDNDKHQLTGREIEVLSLMAEGLTNNEISILLEISPHTVKSHVIHIFNKIGVNDRTHASVWAARHGLI